MKTIRAISLALNMFLVKLVLAVLYFPLIGSMYLLYVIFKKSSKQGSSYWQEVDYIKKWKDYYYSAY